MTITDAQVREVLRLYRSKERLAQTPSGFTVNREEALRQALEKVFGDAGPEKNLPVLALIFDKGRLPT